MAWLSWSIPGAVLLLVALGGIELRVRRSRPRAGPMLSETYVNEITALFYGTKRRELDHRTSISMLRDEDAEGAPPAHGVDLDRGVAVLRPEDIR
jgi:hypothetical protein